MRVCQGVIILFLKVQGGHTKYSFVFLVLCTLYLKKKMLMVLFLKMTIPKCFAQKRANQNTSIAVSAVSLGII